MLFNSLRFLFFFLPVVYFVYWKLRTKNQRYVWLTIAGFCGSWNYKFCALLSTLVSYTAGLGMLRWQDGRWRKLCLVLPITIDLLLLGFFKYFNFGLATIASITAWLKHPISVHPIDIILPIGISFYTFHTIVYIVDSYRRTIRPTRNFFEFACCGRTHCALSPDRVRLPAGRTSLEIGQRFKIQRDETNYALRQRFISDFSRVGETSLIGEIGAPWDRWIRFFAGRQWRS